MLTVYIGNDIMLDSDIILDSDYLLRGSKMLTAADTINIEDSIDERSTLSMSIIDERNRLSFQKGQPVDVYDGEELIFSGVIETAVKNKNTVDMVHDIQCIDWHYLADKRIMAKAYENELAGDIIKDIISTYLADEGVTEGTIQDGALVTEAVFNYVPITDAINAIAEKAGFLWYIDYDKRLYFMERGTTAAPFPVTNKDMLKGSIQLMNGNPQYRNKQYIKGGRDITDPQTQSFKGDGVNQTFVVGYPIAKVPTVTLNDVPQTVGIRGLEENKQWYWAKGDNTITQSNNGIPISTSDTLKVTYQGEFDIVVVSVNLEEIEGRKSIEESGTGIVEDVFDDMSVTTRTAAFELADSKIRKFAKISNQLRFTTDKPGLQPGQLLHVELPDYGLNTDMLIDKVTISTECKGQIIWYDIEAVEGPQNESWTKMFRSMATRGQAFVVRENISDEQVLVTLEQFFKEWEEIETPNIFYEVYPSATTMPGILPMFDPSDRVKAMALMSSGVELMNKPITKQETSAGEIKSTVLVNSYEGNGDITHVRWYGGHFGNIVVDEQVFEKTKTELEAIQIDKTDTKGW
jgi:hypothetical protein